jgi:hypothetical protein
MKKATACAIGFVLLAAVPASAATPDPSFVGRYKGRSRLVHESGPVNCGQNRLNWDVNRRDLYPRNASLYSQSGGYHVWLTHQQDGDWVGVKHYNHFDRHFSLNYIRNGDRIKGTILEEGSYRGDRLKCVSRVKLRYAGMGRKS